MDDDDVKVHSIPMLQHKSNGDSILDGIDVDLGDMSFSHHKNDDNNLLTNTKVSKYSFYQRLTLYMGRVKINEQNKKAVQLVILVEAGTAIQNKDPMKKSMRKEVLLRKYMQIINESEDLQFKDESVRAGMLAGCVCVCVCRHPFTGGNCKSMRFQSLVTPLNDIPSIPWGS
jgi:hypothetical protein